MITGSVRGLGYAIAQRLAQSGCNIVLHGLEPEDVAQEAAQQLRAQSGREVLVSRADLNRVEHIEAMVHDAQQAFSDIDIVINNAVTRHFAPTEALSTSEWNEALAVNLSAAFHIARLVLPGMRANNWGRLINMSSVYGARGAVDRIGYVTTKTALIGMTRAIALETASTGITCNAVSPGTVPSPAILERIAAIARDSGIPEAQATQEYLQQRQPTGRFVAPESVAALILFLCGEAGRDVTGAVLPIDGGWTAA